MAPRTKENIYIAAGWLIVAFFVFLIGYQIYQPRYFNELDSRYGVRVCHRYVNGDIACSDWLLLPGTRATGRAI